MPQPGHVYFSYLILSINILYP